MGIQFFGEFLLNRSVITREQLLAALDLQERRNLKFGVVALQKKYLTSEQIEQINQRQKTLDMRFGELAVSMGLLSEAHCQEILTYQKNNYLYLGEALRELGHINDSVLQKELSLFKEEQSQYALEEVTLPEGIKGSNAVKMCVDLTRKMFVRVLDRNIKVGKGVVSKEKVPKKKIAPYSIEIRLEGAQPVSYILSVSKEVALLIATRLLGPDAASESKSIIEDAVKEFGNMVCGNAAAKLAQLGITSEISPPKTLGSMPKPKADQKTIEFPIHIAEGSVDIRFITPA